MGIAIGLAIILFGLCGLIHFLTMMTVLNHLKRRNYSALKRMLIAFYSAGLAHLFEAGMYALGFIFGRTIGLGNFETGNGAVSAMEAYYFSVVNYTSLGLGDIYPTGHLRFISGVESLNGFLLISCSAAFLFMVMTESEKSKMQGTNSQT